MLNRKKPWTFREDALPDLKATLFPHQHRAVNSILKGIYKSGQENMSSSSADLDPYRANWGAGFLLADHMGLGKTVTTLASIISILSWSAPKDPLRTTEMGSKDGPILVVCPLSMIPIWRSEIQTHTKIPDERVAVYRGKDREKIRSQLFKNLDSYLVIITSFGTLVSEANLAKKDKGAKHFGKVEKVKVINPASSIKSSDPSFLHLLPKRMVVVDEAHLARNPATSTFKSLHLLRKYDRTLFVLLLSATPYNNVATDMAALATLMGRAPLGEGSPKWWQVYLENAEVMAAFRKRCLIARDKAAIADRLPPLYQTEDLCTFCPIQRDLYDDIVKHTIAAFKTFDRSAAVDRFYTFSFVLVWLLRLMQSTTHPAAILGADKVRAYCRPILDKAYRDVVHFEGDEEDEVGDTSYPSRVEKALKEGVVPLPKALREMGLALFEFESTKFRKTREIIQGAQFAKEKTVVFTQWSSMSDLLAVYLLKYGIRSLQFDGRLNSEERKATLDKFKADLSIPVIIMTIKTGGLGLTLTEANHVVILDIWYNPFTGIDQPGDRVYRIGQKKPVFRHILLGQYQDIGPPPKPSKKRKRMTNPGEFQDETKDQSTESVLADPSKAYILATETFDHAVVRALHYAKRTEACKIVYGLGALQRHVSTIGVEEVSTLVERLEAQSAFRSTI